MAECVYNILLRISIKNKYSATVDDMPKNMCTCTQFWKFLPATDRASKKIIP
jgi:hypothetical protein